MIWPKVGILQISGSQDALGGKFNGPDGASPIHHCWLCNSWHLVDRSEFYINWQCPPEETLNGACQEILTPLASTSTSWTSWLGSWAFHNTCDYHWSPATGLLILKEVNALLGKMSISSLRNMSGSSLWSMLNMSISSSSKDVVFPLGSQLNMEERTSRRKKMAKTICKVSCKNIGFQPRQEKGGGTIWHRTIWHRTIWHQDNLAPGQFGTGQFGTRTIWHQHNKNGQFGTGQFGTRTIWHQHNKTDNLAPRKKWHPNYSLTI